MTNARASASQSPSSPGHPRQRRGLLARRRHRFALVLMAPALTFVLALVGYPLIRTMWLSLHHGNLTRPDVADDFVGLHHYSSLLADPEVWRSAIITGIYTVSVTSVSYFLGLAIAVLLNQRMKGASIARILLTLPWAIPGVVAGYIFIWIVDANYGILNAVLESVGIIQGPVAWLSHNGTSLFVVTMVATWKLIPFSILTNLAGLQAVPEDILEAARSDGASAAQSFWFITWPALSQVRTVTVILTFLVTFREFGQIYVMTGGGPARATETLSVRLYVEAFQYFRFGEAAALGMVMLTISVLSTIAMLKFMNREFY